MGDNFRSASDSFNHGGSKPIESKNTLSIPRFERKKRTLSSIFLPPLKKVKPAEPTLTSLDVNQDSNVNFLTESKTNQYDEFCLPRALNNYHAAPPQQTGVASKFNDSTPYDISHRHSTVSTSNLVSNDENEYANLFIPKGRAPLPPSFPSPVLENLDHYTSASASKPGRESPSMFSKVKSASSPSILSTTQRTLKRKKSVRRFLQRNPLSKKRNPFLQSIKEFFSKGEAEISRPEGEDLSSKSALDTSTMEDDTDDLHMSTSSELNKLNQERGDGNWEHRHEERDSGKYKSLPSLPNSDSEMYLEQNLQPSDDILGALIYIEKNSRRVAPAEADDELPSRMSRLSLGGEGRTTKGVSATK